MARNDPTDNGGLFIGRRPGTAPTRYQRKPPAGSEPRRRVDSALATAILIAETLVLATLWAPQPAGWLWIGGHLVHATGSTAFGIVVALLGTLLTSLLTIKLAMVLDRGWRLTRRAGGYAQKDGALERIFVLSMVVAGTVFFVWFHIVHGTGTEFAPLNPPRG